MSPLQVSILIHYHCFPSDYRDGDFSAPAVREAIDWFVSESMLKHSDKVDQLYEPTGGCHAYVNKICEVELPVLVWGYK